MQRETDIKNYIKNFNFFQANEEDWKTDCQDLERVRRNLEEVKAGFAEFTKSYYAQKKNAVTDVKTRTEQEVKRIDRELDVLLKGFPDAPKAYYDMVKKLWAKQDALQQYRDEVQQDMMKLNGAIREGEFNLQEKLRSRNITLSVETIQEARRVEPLEEVHAARRVTLWESIKYMFAPWSYSEKDKVRQTIVRSSMLQYAILLCAVLFCVFFPVPVKILGVLAYGIAVWRNHRKINDVVYAKGLDDYLTEERLKYYCVVYATREEIDFVVRKYFVLESCTIQQLQNALERKREVIDNAIDSDQRKIEETSVQLREAENWIRELEAEKNYLDSFGNKYAEQIAQYKTNASRFSEHDQKLLEDYITRRNKYYKNESNALNDRKKAIEARQALQKDMDAQREDWKKFEADNKTRQKKVYIITKSVELLQERERWMPEDFYEKLDVLEKKIDSDYAAGKESFEARMAELQSRISVLEESTSDMKEKLKKAKEDNVYHLYKAISNGQVRIADTVGSTTPFIAFFNKKLVGTDMPKLSYLNHRCQPIVFLYEDKETDASLKKAISLVMSGFEQNNVMEGGIFGGPGKSMVRQSVINPEKKNIQISEIEITLKETPEYWNTDREICRGFRKISDKICEMKNAGGKSLNAVNYKRNEEKAGLIPLDVVHCVLGSNKNNTMQKLSQNTDMRFISQNYAYGFLPVYYIAKGAWEAIQKAGSDPLILMIGNRDENFGNVYMWNMKEYSTEPFYSGTALHK